MTNILLIQASPRQERSVSNRFGKRLAEGLSKRFDSDLVELDLWKETLPDMNGSLASAKYARLQGKALSPQQAEAWGAVAAMISQLAAASALVVATPMWNFSIPYKLKQYIDIVTQPGLSFAFDPATGYIPLLSNKPNYVVLSSAGDYRSGSSRDRPDLATPYLRAALSFIGFRSTVFVPVGPTVASREDVARGCDRADEQISEIVAGMRT